MAAGEVFDILIIGGGINGAGVARDAAGRGYSVCLCEAGDFASATSSASTKLFHGGVRYLEYFEFRLVREALVEREILLRMMPHISWPMRFVMPLSSEMRFEAETPASKFISFFFPWLRGRRPNWMIRFGLLLYDHMGGRKILPGTKALDLTTDEAGQPLKSKFRKAYEYSDCWVEDSRLVILNLRDAKAKGADINARTQVSSARFDGSKWQVTLDSEEGSREVTAKLIVNATGPWVDEVLRTVFGKNGAANVRLVRGSHIVVAKKFTHDRCYIFQNSDGRIIFAIPYERDYTLIGTTDADHADVSKKPQITQEESDYLCEMASAYFKEPVRRDDIVWTYSGVRPLFDDGATAAQSATRDYVIREDPDLGNGSLINIFGGKITTYRRLAETIMKKIGETLGQRGKAWTANTHLPGGDFKVDQFEPLVAKLIEDHPGLDPKLVRRLARQYGTEAAGILAGAMSTEDLGKSFGGDLYEAEVRFQMENEWVLGAEDAAFRRTRQGLRMSKKELDTLDIWIKEQTG